MLGKRLLTVLIALPLFAGALMFLPQVAWGLFLLPFIAIAGWEWAALAKYGFAGRAAGAAAGSPRRGGFDCAGRIAGALHG